MLGVPCGFWWVPQLVPIFLPCCSSFCLGLSPLAFHCLWGPWLSCFSWVLPLLLNITTAVVWDSLAGNCTSDFLESSGCQSHIVFLAEVDKISLSQFWVTRWRRAVCVNCVTELYCSCSCFYTWLFLPDSSSIISSLLSSCPQP